MQRNYLLSLDSLERRDLPSAYPLGAAPARGARPTTAEVASCGQVLGNPGAPAAIARPVAAAGGVSAARTGTVQQEVDLTVAFLRVADVVLQNLATFDPRSESAATQVRQEIARLIALSPTQPAALLGAPSSEALESLLSTYGPGDPFATRPVLSTSDLRPGDILVRCTEALGSQSIELATWSRYGHAALYAGHGQIVDATGKGVRTRSLIGFLSESNRVGVLRVPRLTAAQARTAVVAACSHRGASYNFTGVTALAVQKRAALIDHAREGWGGTVGTLCRTEHLPPRLVLNGTFGCSQLVRAAFQRAGVLLSHANGLTPGDVIRLGNVGVLNVVGRLSPPAAAPPAVGVDMP